MKVVVKKKETAERISIQTEFIKLESAMKLANVIPSGGTAKLEIQDGNVLVNGEVCTMRGKKLYPGDKFTFDGVTYLISCHGA
jgi:ribosome-associated protein